MGKIKWILFIFLVMGCSTQTPSSRIPRHEYDEVKEKQISYRDVFNVPESKYYLYYYQLNCYHCHSMKSYIIDYAIHSSIPFYFVEIEKDEGFLSHNAKETIGTNNPLEAFALMTPQLSLVENGYVAITVHGKEEIMLLIEGK